MKMLKNKRQNWVLYIAQQNTKVKTELDVLLDKVLDIAKLLGQLYSVSDLSVYASDESLHVEYIFEKRYLFITILPINKIKKLDEASCKFLLNNLIASLNAAKQRIQEKKQNTQV